MDKGLKKIGQKIKQLRKAAGFTSYEKFALHHNMGRKQYWRIENGENITLQTLFEVLDLLDVSVVDFFSSFDKLDMSD